MACLECNALKINSAQIASGKNLIIEFYDSKRHRETGDFKFALSGNAPYIVNRFDGSLVITGTAYDTEHYIAEYERQLQDHAT